MSSRVDQIQAALGSLGYPPERCADLATHLDRRAQQLAEARERSYDEALFHLLRLMAAGGSGPGESTSREAPRIPSSPDPSASPSS